MTIFKMSHPIPMRQHHKHHNLKHRFDLIKTLGQGTYGKVKLAVDRLSGEKVAIKSIKKKKIENDQDLVRIKREIEIMSSLSHPHIVNIQEVFENKDKIILVMEYACGGELYDYISEKTRLEEKEARKIFRQIVSAVHHCHTNGVVHRDLKLENILLDENGDVKIADFGLSNMWSDANHLTTFCGSPLYASPEIVNGVPYHGPEVDCWSLGVLLYTLVYGAMPFDGSDFRRLRKQISEGDYYEPGQPSECSSLIRHLLTVSPKSRATLKDICNHWWTNLHHQSSPIESPIHVDSAFEEDQFDGQHFTFGSDSDLEPGQKTPVSAAKRENRTSDFYEDEIVAAQLAISAALAKCNISSNRTVVPSSGDQLKDSTGSNNHHWSTQEAAQPCSKASDKIFDSEKKPKKSILKNKGRYSGGDSGCVLSSKVRAEAQLDDDGTYCLSDIEKILNPSSPSEQQRRDSGVESSSSDPSTPIGDLSTAVCEAAANTAVVKRRGILKKNSRYENSRYENSRYSTDSDLVSKRYSIGSLSSNSSGDILDFSYNSSDGEQYMGEARYYLPPEQQHVYYNDCPKQCYSVNVFGDSRDKIASKIDMLDHSLDSTPKQSYDGLAYTFDQREGKCVFEKALKLCQ